MMTTIYTEYCSYFANSSYFANFNKANLRDLIAATGLVILLKLNLNCRLFSLWPWNLMDNLEKKKGHLFYTMSSFVQHFKAICKFKLD